MKFFSPLKIDTFLTHVFSISVHQSTMKKLEIRINSSFLMYPSVEKGGYFLFFDFFQENTLFCYRIIPPFLCKKIPLFVAG